MHELVSFLRQKGCNLHGCSKSDVKRIESYFGIELPFVYKEFLYCMGKDADLFMKGSSAFYKEIFYLREDFQDTLDEYEKSLPDNTFVFWSHQGYQFAFFYLDQGDNPAVYFYYEGKNSENFEKKENSLTDFWEKQLAMSGLM